MNGGIIIWWLELFGRYSYDKRILVDPYLKYKVKQKDKVWLRIYVLYYSMVWMDGVGKLIAG